VLHGPQPAYLRRQVGGGGGARGCDVVLRLLAGPACRAPPTPLRVGCVAERRWSPAACANTTHSTHGLPLIVV
jgi:hypothetical protein